MKKLDKFLREQEKILEQRMRRLARLEKAVYKIAEAINLKVA